MKIPSILARLFALTAVAGALIAAVPTHAADTKKVAGPNGGRILTKVEPHAEFFVLPDGKVQITFLDKANKAIALAEQNVTITAGERAKPQTLKFAKVGDTLVSDVPLPKGDAVPAVVQIKANASASLVTERFNVDLSECGECKLAEYACICAH